MLPRERDAVDLDFELKYNIITVFVEDVESMFKSNDVSNIVILEITV